MPMFGSSDLESKERELEGLKLEKEMAGERSEIATRKALERDAKARHGRDWRKIIGAVGSLKPNQEAIQSLYAAGGDLKELNKPPRGIRRA